MSYCESYNIGQVASSFQERNPENSTLSVWFRKTGQMRNIVDDREQRPGNHFFTDQKFLNLTKIRKRQN